MTLEERLRTAIKSGNLLYVSLSRNWNPPHLWAAGYRNGDSNLVQYVEDADPIVALEKAMRPLRSSPPKANPPPIAKQVKPKRPIEDDLI